MMECLMRYSTEPGTHRNPAVISAKVARLREPHIGPITGLVEEIRAETGLGVPYVDPDSGGVNAEVLVLLRSPGRSAAQTSDLLSPDNTGPTARNFWEAYDKTPLNRERTLHWNAVPWYGKAGDAVRQEPAYWLSKLVDLLPNLQVIIGVGDVGYTAGLSQASSRPKLHIHVLHTPMPSQREINSSRPGQVLRRLHDAFRATHELVEQAATLPE